MQKKKKKKKKKDLADKILVNSQFTRSIFKESFKRIDIVPDVLYPGINTEQYEKKIDETDKGLDLLRRYI